MDLCQGGEDDRLIPFPSTLQGIMLLRYCYDHDLTVLLCTALVLKGPPKGSTVLSQSLGKDNLKLDLPLSK